MFRGPIKPIKQKQSKKGSTRGGGHQAKANGVKPNETPRYPLRQTAGGTAGRPRRKENGIKR